MSRIKSDNLHDTAIRVDAKYLREDKDFDDEYHLIWSMIGAQLVRHEHIPA